MPTAKDVANYFLSKTREEIGDNITHLKLQKLVYYAQGFHLAVYKTPLFDEPIEAWDHGPVVPALYKEYRVYGLSPIPGTVEAEAVLPFTEEQLALLDDVYEVYGQFSAWKLRALTHSEPTWEKAYPNGIITHQAMEKFFKTQIDD